MRPDPSRPRALPRIARPLLLVVLLLAAPGALRAQQTSPKARLAAGVAEMRAGRDSAARALLEPLAGRRGRLGGDARRALAELAVRAALADEQRLEPGTLPEWSLGVAPFAVDAADTTLTPLGAALADLLITDLSRAARLQVVDRVRIHALLRELDLARHGAVDPSSAPRAGRLVGARRIVSGSVVALANGSIRLESRVIDAASAATHGAPVGATTSLDALLDAEKALAFALLDELGVVLTPAERRAIAQKPTRDVGAFMAYARGVHDEIVGSHATAASHYAAALAQDPGFTLAAEHLASLPDEPGVAAALAALQARRPPTLGALLDAIMPSPAGALGSISGWPVPLVTLLGDSRNGGSNGGVIRGGAQ